MIVEALEETLSQCDGSPAALVALARAVARELDSGGTRNSQLVKEFRELVQVLLDGGRGDALAELVAELSGEVRD